MLTITAIIRTKPGREDTMRKGLLEVAENVRLNEPETIGFLSHRALRSPSCSRPTNDSRMRPR
jgi:hypothetical protein